MLVGLRLGLRQLIYGGVQETLLVGQGCKQVEAALCKVVILIRIGICQRLQIEVANPQTLVALGAILIYGLHTLGKSLEAYLVNLLDALVGLRSQRRRRSTRRGYGAERYILNAEVVVRLRKKFNLHIAASQTALNSNNLGQTHNGDYLVLQPRAAQATRIWLKGCIQLGRHLGKGELKS